MNPLREPAATRPTGTPGAFDVLEFESQGERFGLPLDCVRRAIMSAQPSPLPGASEVVLGVLNVAGQTVTVVDFARRIGCRPTVIEPSHYFVIVELDGFPCALVVDHIAGIRRHVAGQPPWHGDSEGDALVAGAVQLDDGLCLVLDPGRFLFEQDKKQLASALAEAGHD